MAPEAIGHLPILGKLSLLTFAFPLLEVKHRQADIIFSPFLELRVFLKGGACASPTIS